MLVNSFSVKYRSVVARPETLDVPIKNIAQRRSSQHVKVPKPLGVFHGRFAVGKRPHALHGVGTQHEQHDVEQVGVEKHVVDAHCERSRHNT
jgi:hypothetical protein